MLKYLPQLYIHYQMFTSYSSAVDSYEIYMIFVGENNSIFYIFQGEFTFRDDGKLLYYHQCIAVNSYNLLQLVSCDQMKEDHGAINFHLEEGHGLTQGRVT